MCAPLCGRRQTRIMIRTRVRSLYVSRRYKEKEMNDVRLRAPDPYYRQTMRPGAERERAVMGGHDEIRARHLFPQQGRGQMDRVKRAELRGHRLRRAVENDSVDFHDLE